MLLCYSNAGCKNVYSCPKTINKEKRMEFVQWWRVIKILCQCWCKRDFVYRLLVSESYPVRWILTVVLLAFRCASSNGVAAEAPLAGTKEPIACLLHLLLDLDLDLDLLRLVVPSVVIDKYDRPSDVDTVMPERTDGPVLILLRSNPPSSALSVPLVMYPGCSLTESSSAWLPGPSSSSYASGGIKDSIALIILDIIFAKASNSSAVTGSWLKWACS